MVAIDGWGADFTRPKTSNCVPRERDRGEHLEIVIEYCTRRTFHNRHDPRKYADYFCSARDAILDKFPSARVIGNPEEKNLKWRTEDHLGPLEDVSRPRLGAFEVNIAGAGMSKLIYSKLEAGCFPNPLWLAKRVEHSMFGKEVLPPVRSTALSPLPGVDALKVKRHLPMYEPRCPRTWSRNSAESKFVPKQSAQRVRNLRGQSASRQRHGAWSVFQQSRAQIPITPVCLHAQGRSDRVPAPSSQVKLDSQEPPVASHGVDAFLPRPPAGSKPSSARSGRKPGKPQASNHSESTTAVTEGKPPATANSESTRAVTAGTHDMSFSPDLFEMRNEFAEPLDELKFPIQNISDTKADEQTSVNPEAVTERKSASVEKLISSGSEPTPHVQQSAQSAIKRAPCEDAAASVPEESRRDSAWSDFEEDDEKGTSVEKGHADSWSEFEESGNEKLFRGPASSASDGGVASDLPVGSNRVGNTAQPNPEAATLPERPSKEGMGPLKMQLLQQRVSATESITALAANCALETKASPTGNEPSTAERVRALLRNDVSTPTPPPPEQDAIVSAASAAEAAVSSLISNSLKAIELVSPEALGLKQSEGPSSASALLAALRDNRPTPPKDLALADNELLQSSASPPSQAAVLTAAPLPDASMPDIVAPVDNNLLPSLASPPLQSVAMTSAPLPNAPLPEASAPEDNAQRPSSPPSPSQPEPATPALLPETTQPEVLTPADAPMPKALAPADDEPWPSSASPPSQPEPKTAAPLPDALMPEALPPANDELLPSSASPPSQPQPTKPAPLPDVRMAGVLGPAGGELLPSSASPPTQPPAMPKAPLPDAPMPEVLPPSDDELLTASASLPPAAMPPTQLPHGLMPEVLAPADDELLLSPGHPPSSQPVAVLSPSQPAAMAPAPLPEAPMPEVLAPVDDEPVLSPASPPSQPATVLALADDEPLPSSISPPPQTMPMPPAPLPIAPMPDVLASTYDEPLTSSISLPPQPTAMPPAQLPVAPMTDVLVSKDEELLASSALAPPQPTAMPPAPLPDVSMPQFLAPEGDFLPSLASPPPLPTAMPPAPLPDAPMPEVLAPEDELFPSSASPPLRPTAMPPAPLPDAPMPEVLAPEDEFVPSSVPPPAQQMAIPPSSLPGAPMSKVLTHSDSEEFLPPSAPLPVQQTAIPPAPLPDAPMPKVLALDDNDEEFLSSSVPPPSQLAAAPPAPVPDALMPEVVVLDDGEEIGFLDGPTSAVGTGLVKELDEEAASGYDEAFDNFDSGWEGDETVGSSSQPLVASQEIPRGAGIAGSMTSLDDMTYDSDGVVRAADLRDAVDDLGSDAGAILGGGGELGVIASPGGYASGFDAMDSDIDSPSWTATYGPQETLGNSDEDDDEEFTARRIVAAADEDSLESLE